MVYDHELRTINGRIRGYDYGVRKPRKRERCLVSRRQLKYCGLEPHGIAQRVGRFFSVKELKREMKRDMPDHKIISKNKVHLIKEWFVHGDPADNKLYRIRRRQGGRLPI